MSRKFCPFLRPNRRCTRGKINAGFYLGFRTKNHSKVAYWREKKSNQVYISEFVPQCAIYCNQWIQIPVLQLFLSPVASRGLPEASRGLLEGLQRPPRRLPEEALWDAGVIRCRSVFSCLMVEKEMMSRVPCTHSVIFILVCRAWAQFGSSLWPFR